MDWSQCIAVRYSSDSFSLSERDKEAASGVDRGVAEDREAGLQSSAHGDPF